MFLLSSIFVSWILMLIFSISEIKLIQTITVRDLIIVIALGCLIDGIGYITWTKANRLASERGINISSLASLLFFLPVLSLIIVAIFLQEIQLFQPHFLVSLFFIIVSSVLCQKSEAIQRVLTRKQK